MSRFFFDFDEGDRHTRDPDGLDLADLQSAKDEAVTALSQILMLEQAKGDQRAIECHVRNEAGEHVYSLALSLHGRA